MTLSSLNSGLDCSSSQHSGDKLYDQDFIAWTEEMARLLENRHTEGLDWDNLAEEIRDLGTGLKISLDSKLSKLITYLIRWELQPDRRCQESEVAISIVRIEIDCLVDDHPRLALCLNESFDHICARARRCALLEARLPESTAIPDWSIEQILDPAFLPHRPTAVVS